MTWGYSKACGEVEKTSRGTYSAHYCMDIPPASLLAPPSDTYPEQAGSNSGRRRRRPWRCPPQGRRGVRSWSAPLQQSAFERGCKRAEGGMNESNSPVLSKYSKCFLTWMNGYQTKWMAPYGNEWQSFPMHICYSESNIKWKWSPLNLIIRFLLFGPQNSQYNNFLCCQQKRFGMAQLNKVRPSTIPPVWAFGAAISFMWEKLNSLPLSGVRTWMQLSEAGFPLT